MSHEIISSWLQLPPGNWPPDHYTLLGLKPGEADVPRIEQQAHERMERVRHYQLIHPEQATEAMNRLAQALVCLTDPNAKQAYDAMLSLEVSPATSPQPTSAEMARSADGAITEQPLRETVPPAASPPPDRWAWLLGPTDPTNGSSNIPATELPKVVAWDAVPPPPPRLPLGQEGPAFAEAAQETAKETAALTEPNAEALNESVLLGATTETLDPATEAARFSAASRRGLGTKRALYYHIGRTRQLLWAWEQAGKYLNRPARPVSSPGEATDLIHQMQAMRELARDFPPSLGEAGHPGYLVVALARQQMIVPMLHTLLPSQREALARDWQAGLDLLRAHRHYLRQQLRTLRRHSSWGRVLRGIKTGLRDHPGRVLFLLALVALNLAYPPLREVWLNQVLALGVLLIFFSVRWWLQLRPSKPVRSRPAQAIKRRPATGSTLRRQPNSSRA